MADRSSSGRASSGTASSRRGRTSSHGARPTKGEAPLDRELDVTSLAPGGAGVARFEGRVLLVAGAAPGDRVLARMAQGSAARVLRVISAGPDRIEVPCRVADTCGGCDWMHIAPAARRQAYARNASEMIAHALGVPAAQLPEPTVHAADRDLGYRTRARLLVRAERRGVRVGFRAAGSRDLVAMGSCVVLAPGLEGVAAAIERALAGSRGEGDANVALGRTGDGARGLSAPGTRAPVVDLAWRGELAPAAFAALDAHVQTGAWAGARVTLEGVSAPAVFGDPRPVMTAADGAPLVVAEGGFAQPSEEGGRRLAARVAALGEAEGKHVLELFAGSGTLSVLLARGAASFLGVEQHEPAVRAARENFAARGLTGKLVAADAELYPIPPRTELVVLDPPRTGAREASRAIARARPRRVVYVSCDAATLARDLAVLCGGAGAGKDTSAPGSGPYAVASIDVFELFPQTSHFETVVALVRAPRGRAVS